jgi:hypothetical protein
VKNANKLVPSEEDATPVDPVTENQNILMGKPVKAFIEQDHEAHIAVHMAAAQDPKIQQLVGMSPMAQAIQAAGAAHINEHVAMAYRKQLEAKLGVTLPTEEQTKNMSPEIAARVAQMAAQAAQKLLAQNQQEAAQQQAQQQAEDPVLQLQKMELQIKEQELKRKVMKDTVDAAAKNDQIELDIMRIEAQKEIAGLQAGAKLKADAEKLNAHSEIEGVRLGAQIAKDRREASKPQPKVAPKKKETK